LTKNVFKKKEWHLHDGTLPNTETNYLNYIYHGVHISIL